MVKIVILLGRKPGMSGPSFLQHWHETHAPLILRLPGLRGYVQSQVLDAGVNAASLHCDGIAESWFDDTQAMRTLAKSPEYAAVLADEPNFLDRARMVSIITEEHRLKDGALGAGAVKRVDLLRRRPDLDVDEFQRRWLERHGPLQASVPAVRRLVQSHTRRSAYEGGRSPAYDGAIMAWFDDLAAARSPDSAPEFATARDALATLVALAPFVITRENVVLAPSR